MDQDRKAQPFDIVQKAAHYGKHPSGVEAIELCEVLTFNIGNAFKYIFRRDDKVNPIQDLQKARWYIEREYQRLKRFDWLPAILANIHRVNPDFTDMHWELANAVIEAEGQDSLATPIYLQILRPEAARTYSMRLPQVLKNLDSMIASYTRPQVTADV